MYRIIAVLLCICGLSTDIVAQQACNIQLSVSVVETHNGQPLFPVVVHIDELDKTFETSEKGRFIVDSICAGKYTFHFHALGYEHAAEQVTVLASGELRFRLAHTGSKMEELVVTSSKEAVLQDKDMLDKSQLNQATGKSLADLLQSVNGVTTFSNGATVAKPVIHGMHSNRIVMLNNGIRQEDQQWGGEHAPNIDPFLADNVTVVKGAAGVRYGADAIGGVVLVEPAPLSTAKGTDAEINIVGLSNNRMGVASGVVNHNFSRVPALSIRVQGTYKKGGNYRIPGYWVANTGLEESNYSAAAGWRKQHFGNEIFYSHFNTMLGIYRGAHTGSMADRLAAVNSDTPLVRADFTYELDRPYQHVLHDLLKYKAYLDTRVGVWHLTYGYQHNFRQEYDVQRIATGDAQLNLTLNTQTLNLNLEHRPVGAVKGEVGIDGIVQQNFIRDGDRVFLPNYRSQGVAAYVIERYKWQSWLLEGGARYDYRSYSVFNPEGRNQQVMRYDYSFSNISGTLGVRRKVGKQWDFSAVLANAWRSPQANELFSAGLHHGAARIELGNKNLVPERSYNLNVELEKKQGRFSTDISVYTQYIRNYIYLQPGADLLTIRGYFKTFSYMQTNAWLGGTDLSAGYTWNKHLHSTIKASALLARNVIAKDWLIQMPADRVMLGTRYSFDMGKIMRECFVSADARYVFEQWRIPSNFDSVDYPRPPAAYALLDLSCGTTLYAGKQAIYLSLTAMNALNTRYRDYMDAFRYYIDQPGRNIVLRARLPFDFKNNKNEEKNETL